MSVLNVTPFAAEVAGPFIPRDHARFTVRSPVDVARSSPVPVVKNTSFVFAGRLTPEKGVRLAAEVARDAGLKLTICGDGPLLDELRRFGPPIECTGWLDSTAMSDALRCARALVFPSTWYETGGLVVAEALAQGIPVIASRSTGAAAWIENGVNGFLIDPGNANALRAAMIALTDPETAQRMGHQAFHLYWAKPSTKQAHTEELLAVYRTVLAEHRFRNTQRTARSA
jgi:glycosyltransferase involved in cell wall biosynthesis